MIVTIDGPAGAGKSSAARELAKRLGFRFLDTGAMYRAVTLAALRRGVDLADENRLAQLASKLQIEVDDNRVLLDGQDVTRAIRTFEITTSTHYAADNPGVRARLVELQRQAADGIGVVTEGRDQATEVFPNAECKIFLTASEQVRAERRFADLSARGEQVTFEEVLDNQRQRDDRDASRPIGALRKESDAIEVCTDGMTPQQVVAALEKLVRDRQARADRKN